MKLLAVRAARAIWLVPTAYLNPRGRFLIPVVAALVERYKFAKPPDTNSLFKAPLAIKFEGGAFSGGDGVPKFFDLAVHEDGLVAELRSSTEDAEAALEDALTWLAKEFELSTPHRLPIKKAYISEVSVIFEKPLTIFNERFQDFADSLGPMRLTHLNFGNDPEDGPRNQAIRIEREAGASFADNRYWSSAPMHTSAHLNLLQQFERAASA